MDGATTDRGAFDETVVFLSYFKNLADPRQQGKVTYPLDEILLLCLLGVLAGAETFVDIALFGTKKLAFLRRLRPFSDGTPAHDHLGDILAALDAEQFQRCFVAWVAALIGAPEGVIAIKPAPAQAGGKTVRRSHQKADPTRRRLAKPRSTWFRPSPPAVSLQPTGLSRGASCWARSRSPTSPMRSSPFPGQGERLFARARYAGDRGGHRDHRCAHGRCDGVPTRHRAEDPRQESRLRPGVEGQPRHGSRQDVEVFVAEQKATGFKDATISRDETVDGDHGRIETRTTTVIHDVTWLQERHA